MMCVSTLKPSLRPFFPAPDRPMPCPFACLLVCPVWCFCAPGAGRWQRALPRGHRADVLTAERIMATPARCVGLAAPGGCPGVRACALACQHRVCLCVSGGVGGRYGARSSWPWLRARLRGSSPLPASRSRPKAPGRSPPCGSLMRPPGSGASAAENCDRKYLSGVQLPREQELRPAAHARASFSHSALRFLGFADSHEGRSLRCPRDARCSLRP